MKPLQHGRWHWWLAPVLAGAAAVLWMLMPDASPVVAAGSASAAAALSPGGATTSPARSASAASSSTAGRSPFSAAGLQARQEQRALWQQRLERAQGALQAYRDSTRYPHDSQPASAHVDQMQPNQPIAEEHVFRTVDGKIVNGVRLLTTQERVFVQGSETVRFTVSLRDSGDKPQPLRIVRAIAREIPAPRTAASTADLPLNFNDEGSSGDLLPGDGIYSVQLQPATQGFGGLLGQIRVEVFLQYRDQQTSTYFDILYTPESPATWAGGVQDGLQDGSLVFTLKADVKLSGRYVVTGRVDDATGKPFALVSFNDEVGTGAQVFRLVVFGKLVRDMKPAFPLTLRDVDGFLLRADAFPDRALMPRLPGKLHVSQSYALTSFSDAEWTSEERNRYLGELNQDVSNAQSKVDQLGKGP
jgi:hypothetical protein